MRYAHHVELTINRLGSKSHLRGVHPTYLASNIVVKGHHDSNP
jgi:hypothetical protein